jgi:cation transport ATPase
MLDGKEELLKDVSELNIFENKGLSAVIEGERVFIGTTDFLKSCNIRLPDEDYEQRLARGSKTVLLYAEKGKLTAVFVTSYGIANSAFSAIGRFESENISVVVYTDDYNIDEDYLAKRLKIKNHEIFVFGFDSGFYLREALKPRDRASSSIVSVSGISGVEVSLKVARRLKRTVKACMWLKTVSIFIGLLVGGFIIISGSAMSPMQITGFSSLWAILVLLASLLGL